MIQLIVSLRDVKSEAFMAPFFVPTVGVGFRLLQDEMRRDQASVLAMHTSDFDLYQLGHFDNETGEIAVPTGFPVKICSVASLLIPAEPQ